MNKKISRKENPSKIKTIREIIKELLWFQLALVASFTHLNLLLKASAILSWSFPWLLSHESSISNIQNLHCNLDFIFLVLCNGFLWNPLKDPIPAI